VAFTRIQSSTKNVKKKKKKKKKKTRHQKYDRIVPRTLHAPAFISPAGKCCRQLRAQRRQRCCWQRRRAMPLARQRAEGSRRSTPVRVAGA
jgi:hypothetical protein